MIWATLALLLLSIVTGELNTTVRSTQPGVSSIVESGPKVMVRFPIRGRIMNAVINLAVGFVSQKIASISVTMPPSGSTRGAIKYSLPPPVRKIVVVPFGVKLTRNVTDEFPGTKCQGDSATNVFAVGPYVRAS